MSKENGFVVIDKPGGITSHDVVAKIRRALNTKKVGHAGTLDPMATGVLVLGVNDGTKFLSFITDGKKRYEATICLGASTVTDDKEGEILSTADVSSIKDDVIRFELAKFVGRIMQRPSSVSAIKVDGVRSYDRVRKGEQVELPPREVEIYELKVVAIRRDSKLEIDIDVQCSAGTYIRAIARDLGVVLGVGGHLTALRRTEVSPFTLDDVSPLEEPQVRPLKESLEGVMPSRLLNEDLIREVRFGRFISASPFEGPGIAIDAANNVIAIIENHGEEARPINVFNP